MENLILRTLFSKGAMLVKQTEVYPKSIKKAIKYIKQDASADQLKTISRLIDAAIEKEKVY